MKQMILLLALSFFTSAISANESTYYPSEFLDAFKNRSWDNDTLRDQLFVLLNSYHKKQGNQPDQIVNSSCGKDCYKHEMLGYSLARRHLFGDIHLKKDNSGEYYIEEVYCDRIFTDEDFKKPGSLGEMQIPNNEVMNCEHTWPQSKFSRAFNNELQKSDLHHLYPSESNANSTRGHKRFGEVKGTETGANCTASHVGNLVPINGLTGREIYFEPPAYHRGNVARALFYFSVRYKIRISPEEEAYLKKWHREDPVDLDEEKRNDRIFELQHNRNPFIDHPALVEQVNDF